VPHQLCHFHFLRNIARPTSEMDRALKVDIKKKVRGIKLVEQKVSGRSDKQSQLVYKYCQAIRFALQDDGCYPLKPGGLQLYSRLQIIQQAIERNNKHCPNAELQKLLRILFILDVLKPRYNRIKRLYTWIFRVNRILRQDKAKNRQKSSAQVEADLFLCFNKFLTVNSRQSEDRLALENVLRFMASYWEGLFCYYGKPEILRSNNDLEWFICCLKVSYRKITGRVSCQSYVVWYGVFVVLFDDSLSCEKVLCRFRSVGVVFFARFLVRFRGLGSVWVLIGGWLRILWVVFVL